MEWLNRMNDALEYMENNLNNDISLEKAAQMALLSQYQFQRMFSYMASIPLSVYLRQRRLTKAAFDLQNGDKVIDVSLRYGYESPTAFNRAFQAVHGISPSAAQKLGAVLKAFPRISFQIMIKGVSEMEYRIVQKEAFRIVGVRIPITTDIEENIKIIPPFWNESFESGKVQQILGMMNGEPTGLLGASACEGDEHFYYIAVATDKQIPGNMHDYTIPKSTWAIFTGTGNPASIQDLQRRVFTEWLPTSGYEWAESSDIEVYLDDNPTNMKYEVWLPITKKA